MNRAEEFLNKMPDELRSKAEKLIVLLQSTQGIIIAMSAGVDSTFLAAAAYAALGSKAIAVTGISPSIPQREVKAAQHLASVIGIRHLEVKTCENDHQKYRANGSDRCFHCKTDLFQQLWKQAKEIGIPAVADGSNSDDRNDYRPGLLAAAEQQVISPLVEAGFTKADIRAAAQAAGLPNHAKPSSPCLSSRFPYGTEITEARLKSVEIAEDALFELGFSDCRVRTYGEIAVIELPLAELPVIHVAGFRENMFTAMKDAGFKHVVVDALGLRSGNLNAVLNYKKPV
ncbi:MAG: ATP-dependent sacrificial sulfur transferase LarE [Lentisphaerota bacterium]